MFHVKLNIAIKMENWLDFGVMVGGTRAIPIEETKMSYGKQEQLCESYWLKRNGKSHPTRRSNGYRKFMKLSRNRKFRRLNKHNPQNDIPKLPYYGYE